MTQNEFSDLPPIDDEHMAALLAASEKEEAAADARAQNVVGVEGLMALAFELEQLDEVIDSMEEQLKEKKKRRDEIKKRELPDEMQRLGIVKPDGKGNFSMASGARISLTTRLYASCRAADKDKMKDWLRSTGAEALIKEDVSGSALSGHVRELLDDGKMLPTFITTFRETTATITKPKK